MKRNDIQALRGFAVLAVLLYHLLILRFKGGFLGVDIFFVISGFVITERLARGNGSVRSQLMDFYQRRAKRILPASLLVIILTAICVRLFLSPLSWRRFGFDGIATTFFAGNLRFAAQGNDYLSQSMSPTPYLHYWSLGVEEQFYLIWPLLFLFFFKARKYLLLHFACIATAFAIWYTHISPVNSFYQPFSRAWEFLAGICVALLVQKPTRGGKPLALVGWVAISASILFIGSNQPVPGITTLIPVLGAVAILVASERMPWERLLVRVGDYSYAIYLVHWPLVVIALARYQGLSTTLKVAIGLLSIIGGFLISRFIEWPFRFNKRFTVELPIWGLGLIAAGAMVFGTTSFASATPSIGKAAIDLSEPIIYADKCHLDFGVDKPISPCLFGDVHSQVEVVLVGDSHAAQWFNAVEQTAQSHHWKLLSLTKSSCPAAFMATKRNGVADGSCARWQKYVASRIRADHPAKVFITAFSEYTYPLVQSGQYASLYADGQAQFVRALELPASSIYYLEDSPHPPVSIPDCLAKHAKNTSDCDFTLKRSSATIAIHSALTPLGIHYLNFNQLLCSKSNCSALLAGHNTYRDSSHISVSTSKALASNFSALVS
jgi:peptidoglycan/LPS O-acetylase OafA/YrhL